MISSYRISPPPTLGQELKDSCEKDEGGGKMGHSLCSIIDWMSGGDRGPILILRSIVLVSAKCFCVVGKNDVAV